jgi:ABC-type antimicrobial peptide transport system permease subunit
MFQNNFKLAWRNFLKSKQFSLLNLAGLSTSLACVLLIFLWVNDELHVDKFNAKDARLYEVLKKNRDGNGSIQIGKHTQGTLASAMAAELPEIEYAVPVRIDRNTSILSSGETHIKVQHEFAGKDFFKVFSYPLVSGNNQEVSGVSGIFLSDELALKLFNTTNIVGKTVSWNYKEGDVDFSGPYTVSGVYESPPSNATNQFDMLLPFDLYAKKHEGGMGDVTFWGSNMVTTFIILKPGTNINAFRNKIKDFSRQKIKSLYAGNDDMQKWEGDLFVRRYSDAYLYNNYVNGVQAGGRIEYVTLFSIIALFILIIACINFMNLSTARAAGRMKEVGIRKIAGAPRSLLLLQYMIESMIMAFLSILIAIVLASLLLPVFKEITGKELSVSFSARFILSALSIAIITGIIAGSYPALYLSRFKPALVLKGKLNASVSESIIRKGLVVFQFAVSIVLIIGLMVVHRQMQLIQTKNLGYDKDNIIRFSGEGKLKDHPQAFLTEVKNIPGVINAAGMEGDFLGHAGHSGGGIGWDGKDPNLTLQYYGVSGDYNFMELLGLKIEEGRSFSAKFGSDSSSVIFNQSAIAAMGIKNPVGKTVSLWGHKKQIIGIVKDFYFESLYKKVGPAFLEYSPTNESFLVKIKEGTETETIARLAKFYKSFNEGLPFDYKFLDDDYQAMYASEQKVATLSKYFATIAIIISCLGLFGLAAFTAQKRQKEIGVRKVVGASVRNIAVLLSKDFLKLVLIAILIAFPLAWWAVHQWLEGFAYRINIDPGTFFIAGTVIIFFTLFTVSFQAIKAAVANPVKSLRTE